MRFEVPVYKRYRASFSTPKGRRVGPVARVVAPRPRPSRPGIGRRSSPPAPDAPAPVLDRDRPVRTFPGVDPERRALREQTIWVRMLYNRNQS